MHAKTAFDALHVIALTLLPAAAYATGVTLGESLGAVTPRDWLMVLVLSAVAGLVALLKRMKEEAAAYEAKMAEWQEGLPLPPAPNWMMFIVVHMTSALASGVVCFLACESFNVEDFREALIIAVGAWTGARILDTFSEGLLGALRGAAGQSLGKR